MTFREFCQEQEKMGFPALYAGQAVNMSMMRESYDEMVPIWREQEQRAADARYFDPYNEAVSLFLEYQMGYVDVAQPSNRV